MIKDFYNELAPYYKLLHRDWEASITNQAEILDSVIREFIGEDVRTILDAACGIGTQTIGLALKGYILTASDFSPAAVKQAQIEATTRGLNIEFTIGDMRQLWQLHNRQFDVVIACDNAIPHLLSETEIRSVIEQFYHCTLTRGGCIISVRDYSNMERSGFKFYPRVVHETEKGRMVLFDVWDFHGDYYDMSIYIVEDTGGAGAETHVIRGGRYFCVSLETLENLFIEAGFTQVRIIKDVFYQPLIVALKI